MTDKLIAGIFLLSLLCGIGYSIYAAKNYGGYQWEMGDGYVGHFVVGFFSTAIVCSVLWLSVCAAITLFS